MAKFKQVKREVILSIDYDELIKYRNAVNVVIKTFKGDFGKIGEHGNALLALNRDFDEILEKARDW